MEMRLLLVAVLAVSCQEYGFEEVPSSTVNVKRFTQNISVSADADILFVIDNSRSMVGEQTAIGRSFKSFTDELDKKFGLNRYQIAVITTGVESQACDRCNNAHNPPDSSCINETGETGRFQSRKGWNTRAVDDPMYQDDPLYEFGPEEEACRIIRSDNLSCFFEEVGGVKKGVVFTGVQGCSYEKGLEAVRMALTGQLINTQNRGFLRPDAALAVVVVSDEEDCGKVGDTNELTSAGANICYYASLGASPDGNTKDDKGKTLALTPVEEYYDFLIGLKNRKGLVKFAAITGVTDEANPSATQITYNQSGKVINACRTPEPDCTGDNCSALPGTRYIALAEMFGLQENGFVATICQKDFSKTLAELGTWVGCQKLFKLSEPILDPGLASILINDVPVPTFTCADKDQPIKCSGLSDSDINCPGAKACVRTWTYKAPDLQLDPKAPGGVIEFADHYDPCTMNSSDFRLELVYATP